MLEVRKSSSYSRIQKSVRPTGAQAKLWDL